MNGDSLIVELAERVFRDLADPQTVNAAVDDSWRADLWATLEDMELPKAWAPETLGGSGLAADEIVALAMAAGRFALSVPLIETILAHWLLGFGNLSGGEGPGTIAPVASFDRLTFDETRGLSGTCTRIPADSDTTWAAVVAADPAGGLVVGRVDLAACAVQAKRGLAGDAEITVRFDGAMPSAVGRLGEASGPSPLSIGGAALRAAQMAGALQGMLALTVSYAQEREAFGRPIGKFQAIQHSLARLAGHTAASVAVATAAADCLEAITKGGPASSLPVASAKIRVGEAATAGAAVAHQVFGAMGFTAECVLQRYSHRLWAWRDDFGTEAEWSLALGRQVARLDAADYWPTIVAGGIGAGGRTL